MCWFSLFFTVFHFWILTPSSSEFFPHQSMQESTNNWLIIFASSIENILLVLKIDQSAIELILEGP